MSEFPGRNPPDEPYELLDGVQEHDVIVRRRTDGEWAILQRQGASEIVIGGAFVDEAEATFRARAFAIAARVAAFIEMAPGVRRRLRL